MQQHGNFAGPIAGLSLSTVTFLVSAAHALHSWVGAIAAVGSLLVGLSSVGSLSFRVFLYVRHGDRPDLKR